MPYDKIRDLLNQYEFVNVATSDFSGKPNLAPKLLLKCDGNVIFLIDYVIGRTFENLKANPRVSLSIMDSESLTGYQLNGNVEIIESGKEHERILKELHKKQIALSSKRVVEGLYRGKTHQNFEATMPDKVIVFKIKITEIVEIATSGQLKRENFE
jgi:predicted pyridoxine 5'-phosphate oxidase superfamily flavin-nucleotide-binding protein